MRNAHRENVPLNKSNVVSLNEAAMSVLCQRTLCQIEAVQFPVSLATISCKFSLFLFVVYIKSVRNDFFFNINAGEKVKRSFKHSTQCPDTFAVVDSSQKAR